MTNRSLRYTPRRYHCGGAWLTLSSEWEMKYQHVIYYVRDSEGKCLLKVPTFREAKDFINQYGKDKTENA